MTLTQYENVDVRSPPLHCNKSPLLTYPLLSLSPLFSIFHRVRGPKKHLKRINAPKKWNLPKMGGLWAPKPAAGPHKQRECLPVAIILRDRLKYALTNKECMQICMERCVKVDGKVRTEANFPTGFMDIVELEKSGDVFRVMLDVKGRFVLHRVNKDESAYKLCKVTKSMITNNKVPVVVTHDGRTIRYPDPDVKANDTIKVDLATGKMSDIFKFTLGATVMITKGHNAGRVGHLMHIEKHDGSFSIATVKDAKGNSFSTRLQNVFVIGNGDKAEVSLPKGKGIKKTIIETRSEMESRGFL